MSRARLAAAAAWLLGGAFIAAASMESLWVAWMLACPWFASPTLLRSWTGIALLAGTIPLAAMQPAFGLAVVAAAGWQAWGLARSPADSPTPSTPDPPPAARWRPAFAVGLACAFTIPFIAPAAGGAGAMHEPPPPGAMVRRTDATSYTLRLVGQSPDVELAWFGSSGGGRHHALPVCLRYRGVQLRPSSEDGVMTDGSRWMREFFLQDGLVLTDYPSYLRRTFLPFSSTGVHLVVAAPVASMSAGAFAHTADRLVQQLDRLARSAS